MKGVITRAISGAVYVAIIVGSLLCGEELVFSGVFAFITALAVFELLHIADDELPLWIKILDIYGAVSVFYFFPMAVAGIGAVALVPMLVYFMARLIAQLYLPEINALRGLAVSFLGVCYVGFPLALTALIYTLFGPVAVLAMFVFLWLNDTGAYCVGCTLGRHRLFERISPKKSWEGFWGGFAVCIAAGAAAGVWSDWLPELGLWGWIAFGAVVSVIGTWGDLVESLLKRTIGVKDAGHIIPGHGGILDRIDSLLLAAPAVLLLLIALCY